MRILAIVVILCTLLSVGCSNEKSDYDADIAAYERGHYQVAISNFESRAMRGDPVAQFCLGYMYKHGIGVAADNRMAMTWYTKAANQGYTPALNNLAKIYEDRGINSEENKVNSDSKRAEELWKQAAEKGNPTAQANLGFVYLFKALYLEKAEELLNLEKAEELLKKAENQGLPRAAHFLGILYIKKGNNAVNERNSESANNWYEMAKNSYLTAVKKGYVKSQHYLGLMYYNGEGVAASLTKEKRWKKAFEWYEKAAGNGFAEAQQTLALMYYLGRGVAQNPEKAVELWKKAADQGNVHAQNNLAGMYAKSEGMSKSSPEMASRWYFMAAQQGNAFAQFNIGQNFKIGRHGLHRDNEEAYYWYGLALRDPNSLNSRSSHWKSGRSYLGEGTINENPATAVTKWREMVGNKLSPDKKKEIQKRVDSWKPKAHIGSGTGFYINENYILTNAHVVIIDNDMKHRYDEFRIPYRRVKLIAWDPEVDLALLYDERRNIDTAKFRRDPVDMGEDIVSFGYPESSVLSYRGNVTPGIVSGISGMLKAPHPDNYFQHTAPIQGGNSGGPVFDYMGNVVGVTTSKMVSRVQGGPIIKIDPPQNVNFAIKFDIIQKFLNKVRNQNNIIVNTMIMDNGTEDLGKGPNHQQIYENAKKFTVPVLSFIDKKEKRFEIDSNIKDIGISMGLLELK